MTEQSPTFLEPAYKETTEATHEPTGYDRYDMCPIEAGLEASAEEIEELGDDVVKSRELAAYLIQRKLAILGRLQTKVVCPGPQLHDGKVDCPLRPAYDASTAQLLGVYTPESYGLNLPQKPAKAETGHYL